MRVAYQTLAARFRADRRGGVAIISAFALLVVLALAALAIDVASFYYVKRRLQGAADLAAMAAANDVANAEQAARASLVGNGYPATALVGISTGNYTADGALRTDQRYVPLALHSGNSAQVRVRTEAPHYFAGAVFATTSHAADRGASSTTIEASATATKPVYVSFAIGSRLVKLDGGLLNALLGSLLGGRVSLTAVDYQSLADANIDLFKFSDALATRTSLTALTYDGLANSSVKIGDVFAALVDAERASPGSNATAIAALLQVADLERGASGLMKLNPLVDFGPLGALPVGSQGLLGVSVSALDLLTAMAELANGTHQAQAALDLGLPGIVSADLLLTVGERPVGTSWVAIGQTGATVHTAQIRLYLKVKLLGSGILPAVTVPLYLEVASATARLSAASCTPAGAAQSVTLDVTPALVDAWIGTVTPAAMANFSTAPSATSATLVTLAGIASVSGRAHATMTNMQATPVTFSAQDISGQRKKTTSTQDFVTSLVSRLISDTQLTVIALGLPITVPLNLAGSVLGIIQAAAPSIDVLLDRTLQTLGIGLGQADTWVTGIDCRRSVLVN